VKALALAVPRPRGRLHVRQGSDRLPPSTTTTSRSACGHPASPSGRPTSQNATATRTARRSGTSRATSARRASRGRPWRSRRGLNRRSRRPPRLGRNAESTKPQETDLFGRSSLVATLPASTEGRPAPCRQLPQAAGRHAATLGGREGQRAGGCGWPGRAPRHWPPACSRHPWRP